LIIEIIAHADYESKDKRLGVGAEIHFFVDDSLIPRDDITPERLQRAFRRWLRTDGDAGKGITIDLIEWSTPKKSSDDYGDTPRESLNEGLRSALKKSRLNFEEEDEEI